MNIYSCWWTTNEYPELLVDIQWISRTVGGQPMNIYSCWWTTNEYPKLLVDNQENM